LKDKHDLLVIPGGAQGAETMSKHPSVQELVRRYLDKGKLVGMICAGAFDAKTLFASKKCEWFNTGSMLALTAKLPSQPLTSHPSVRSLLENGKRIQTIVFYCSKQLVRF
jgi:protein DJ-1